MIELSSSQVTCFDTCKKKYYYRYIKGIETKCTTEALYVGTIFHEAMKEIHEGIDLQRVIIKAKNSYLISNDEKDYVSKEYKFCVLEAMITNAYDLFYKGFDINIVESEKHHKDRVPMSTKKNSTYLRGIRFVYIPDMVIEQKDGIYIVEYKTKGRLSSSYLEKLEIDFQKLSYAFFLSRKLNKPIRGIIYRIIIRSSARGRKNESLEDFRTRMNDEYENNPEKYFVEDVQLIDQNLVNEYHKDLLTKIKEVRGVRNMKLYSKNTSACDYYNSTCEYLPLCRLIEGAEVMYQERVKR